MSATEPQSTALRRAVWTLVALCGLPLAVIALIAAGMMEVVYGGR